MAWTLAAPLVRQPHDQGLDRVLDVLLRDPLPGADQRVPGPGPHVRQAAGLSATTCSAVQNEQIWCVTWSAGAARRPLLVNRNGQGHELPRRRLEECLEFR